MAGVGSPLGQSLTEVNGALAVAEDPVRDAQRVLLLGRPARRDVVPKEPAEAVESDRPEGEERRLALVMHLDEEEAELLGQRTAGRIAPDDLAAERPFVVLEVAQLLLVVGGQILAGLDLGVADADVDGDPALLAADRGQRLADVDDARGHRRAGGIRNENSGSFCSCAIGSTEKSGLQNTTTPAAGVAIAIEALPRPLKATLTPRRRSSPSPVRTALTSVTGRGIAEPPSAGTSRSSGICRAVMTGERSSSSRASPSSIAGKISNAASTGPDAPWCASVWRKPQEQVAELELEVALDLGRLERRAEQPDQVRADLDRHAEQLVDQVGDAAVHREHRADVEPQLDQPLACSATPRLRQRLLGRRCGRSGA